MSLNDIFRRLHEKLSFSMVLQECGAILDAQFAARPAFYKPCPARIFTDFQTPGINYRQEIGDLRSEPKAPALGRQFGDPVATVYRLERMKSVARLYVIFNGETFVTIENNNPGNRFLRYRIDANYLDGEASFIT